MKRVFACGIMVVAMMANLLVGCQTKEKDKDTAEGTTSVEVKEDTKGEAKDETKGETKVAEVTYWQIDWGAKYNAITQEIIDEFNKRNKDIKVKMELKQATPNSSTLSGYDELFIPAFVAGTQPEIINPMSISDGADNNVLFDLTDYITNDPEFDLNMFYKWKLESVKYKGRYYGLPYQTYIHNFLVYNKTLFKDAGLDPNKPPETLEELDSMAERLTKTDASGNYTQVGFYPWQFMMQFPESLAATFGGHWLDKDGNAAPDAGIEKALEWVKKYRDKYGYDKVDAFIKAQQNPSDAFRFGKVGMASDYVGGVSRLIDSNVSFEWDVAPMPAVDGASSAWPGGWHISVVKGSKNPEAAVKFLKFYLGKEGQTMMMKYFNQGLLYGYSPIHEVNLKYVEGMKAPLVAILEQVIPFLEPQSAIANPRSYYALQLETIEKVKTGQGEIKQLLEDLKRKGDVAIKEASNAKVLEKK